MIGNRNFHFTIDGRKNDSKVATSEVSFITVIDFESTLVNPIYLLFTCNQISRNYPVVDHTYDAGI